MRGTSSHSALHVVVIGGSLAGVRAAVALRELGFSGRLTLVDAELVDPYDRPPLSKGFLAQALTGADIRLGDASELDATRLRGRRAVGASMTERLVDLDDGTSVRFDGLIIATGARPRTGLGVPSGAAASPPTGAFVLRSLSDAVQLRRALSTAGARVVVVGAGFIGTEVAATAAQLGHTVSLLDAAAVPLGSAVGATVGGFVADLHHRHGVDLHLGAPARELHVRDGRVQGVVVAEDTVVPADFVVLGLGAIPNVEWLRHSGSLLDDGVRTDAGLRVLDTSGEPIAGVVAVGDAARWPHPLFDDEPVRLEHWSNAAGHAPVAARNLLADLATGDVPTTCRSVPSFWSDQYDHKLMSIGLPHLGEESTLLEGRVDEGRFVVGFGRRGRMVGAVGVDSPRSLATYRRLISRRGPWPPPVHPPLEARTGRPHHAGSG